MAKEAVKVVFDRKKRAERLGHGIIDIVINFGSGERKYMAFGTATPMEWRSIEKSKELLNQVAKYKDMLEAMQLMGEKMTKEAFEAHLGIEKAITIKKEEEKKQDVQTGLSAESFIEFVRDMQTQENVTKATMKHKRVTLRSLEQFGRIQTFADLTPANIMAYDRFLYNGVRKDVTIATYHKYVRYYINILLMEERIPRDPYARVKIKKGERFCANFQILHRKNRTF